MIIKKAVLKSFDAGTYKAVLQMAGSDKAYLIDVAVARNIASAEMVSGSKLAVLFFDEHNAGEAVVVGVY
jgi:glucose uptake protein GlcU